MEVLRRSVRRPTATGSERGDPRRRAREHWSWDDSGKEVNGSAGKDGRFKKRARSHGIPQRTCTLSLLLSLFCSWAHVVLAQEFPLLNTAKFDQSVPARHRQDLCGRQRMLYSDEIELAYALEGIDLSVVLTDYSSDSRDRFLFALDEQGQIPTDYPGLFAVILDELARRAKFRWRDSFGVIKPLDAHTDGNKTWTDILLWEIDTYDLGVEYWSKSIERLALGVSFPEGWYDSSIVFVEQIGASAASRKGNQPFNVLNFLTPFELGVWMLIVVAIVVTGLVYWTLEMLDNGADARNLIGMPSGVIFLSAMTFTGHFEFRPNTHVARLVAWSWAFWALITVAAYTANLASFLVSRGQPVFRILSADQAVRAGTPLCVKKNNWNEIQMRNKYGMDVNLVRKATDEEMFLALRAGECEAAISQVDSFRSYEHNADVNGDCTLKLSGVTVSFIEGGFATAADPGTLCTSLVSHVLDLHMMRMKADGFIERAWEEHLRKASDHECGDLDAAAEGGDAEGESTRLGMKEMGGIFVFHALICAFALSVGVVQYCVHRRYWSKLAGEDVIANTDSPCTDEVGSDGDDEEEGVAPLPPPAQQAAAVDLGMWNSNHTEKKRPSLNQRVHCSRRDSLWDYRSNYPHGLGGMWKFDEPGEANSREKSHDKSQLLRSSMPVQLPSSRNRKSRLANSAVQSRLAVLQEEEWREEEEAEAGQGLKRRFKRRSVSDSDLFKTSKHYRC